MDAGRKLGPGLATVLVAGNMIGSGVYLLPATLGAIGSVSVFGWAIAAVGAMLLAGVFGALGALRPTTEGAVAYAGEGLGRFFGFQAGWLYWISCWVGDVAIAVAVTGYLTVFLPVLHAPPAAAAATIAVIWLLTLANLVGPRLVGLVQGATLVVGLVPVLAAGLFGWLWFQPDVFFDSWNVSGRPAAAAVQASLVSVFWAFLGLESAAMAAAAVRSPARNVPIATVGGVALAAVVYILATTALMGLAPADELATSSAPFAMAMQRIGGAAAAALIAACALIKAAGTLGGWILVTAETSRWTAAAGYLPAWLARVRADGSPAPALLCMAVLMSAVVCATVAPTLRQQFSVLINVTVVLSLIVYAYCCLALLRYSRAVGDARARRLLQATAVLALAFCAWVTAVSGVSTLAIAAGLMAVTALLWLLFRGRVTATSAASLPRSTGSTP